MLKGWQDYFDTLLNNRNANVDKKNKPQPSRPLNSIKTAPFTKIEIDQAIKEFSRKKSPGPDYDSMDIKPYYNITKERKSPANAELERHLLDVTCCQAIQPLDFKSNPLTNRCNTEEKSSWL